MARPAGPYDAVVIGAGHNSLVTAAYLANARLRTLVLERRERIGGILDTIQLGPGVRAPAIAQTVGRLRPSVARDLGLRGHGLTLWAPDVRVFAPQPDGRSVSLWAENGHSLGALRSWSAGDADAYVEFDRLVRSLGQFLEDLGTTTPPEVARPGLRDALASLSLGRRYRGLGRDEGRTILRILPMAVADFLAESFETDALRATLAWRGVRNASLGPWSAGTTLNLLTDSAGNDGGAAGETVLARGGPLALAEALGTAARTAGADIRTEAEVVAILNDRDGRATGVSLRSGEEIAAPIIVSGVDPKRTLTGLCDPVAIGPELHWRAGNIRQPGVVAMVALALAELPHFPAATDERLLRGRILVGATGIDALERAFDASKYGRISEELVLEATIPSLVDPSLVEGAPAGTHVMSVHVQWAPYSLREGGAAAWDGLRDTLADRVVRSLEAVAPGIGDLVTARHVLTPLDLERDYGLTGGHPYHAEPALESWFLWRPLLGHARYRLPLQGLYLCGSGAHPGGGITGGPGQNAAREIIADWKRRRR